MANGTGVTIRSSVESLERAPAPLAALRDAYEKMQRLNPADNRSWNYWAGLHGFPQWQCWHHGRVGMGRERPYNLFLPWHRAYLLYFENNARDQNGAAAIPWWDWTSATAHEIGLPRSFAAARVGNQPNPLHAGPAPRIPPGRGQPGEAARDTVRFPGDPAELPTTERIEAILGLTSFTDFQIQLEDVHDFLHGWTGGINPNDPSEGGDMGAVARAAFDPIFWSHHCMIDRLWYLWELRHGVENVPPDYKDRTLAPFALTVEDVLDVRRLGYEYAQSVSPPVPGPTD